MVKYHIHTHRHYDTLPTTPFTQNCNTSKTCQYRNVHVVTSIPTSITDLIRPTVNIRYNHNDHDQYQYKHNQKHKDI